MKNVQDFRHLSKGTSILKAGFETGVHALPPEAKEEIDRLLSLKYPPKEVLRLTSQKFPGVTLPSKTALHNYHNKYFDQSLVKTTGIDDKLAENQKDYQKALRVIQGLMGLAQNIGVTYKSADDQLKRYYLNLFFGGGGFFVKDGKIVKAKLSNDVKPLIKDGSVRVRMNWLRD